MSQHAKNEKKLHDEIKEKAEILDCETYDFGPALSKVDIVLMIIIGVISITGLIWGGL